MKTMIYRKNGILNASGMLSLTFLVVTIAGGCAFWSERTGERGESGFFQAEWEEVFAATRGEVEERGFIVRHAGAREGRLVALSPLSADSSFRGARQTELDFRMEEGIPGEVEVRLVIREIEERDTVHGPSASRVVVRESAFHRQILDGIEARLMSGFHDEAP